MNDYEREELAKRRKITKIVKDVAKWMPPWKYSLGEHEENLLVRDDIPGAAVHIKFDWQNNDKLRVFGHYPDGYSPSGESAPVIGVSAKKPADKIAADIKRRFVDDYLALFLKTCEAHDTDIEACRRTNEYLLYLQSLYPGSRVSTVDPQHRYDGMLSGGSYRDDGFRVKMFPSTVDTQTVGFEMSAAYHETVCAIIELLYSIRQARQASKAASAE